MFITFEGIDGCGKTTQLNKVAEFLKSQGREVLTLREPGGTDISEKIRELLLQSKKEMHSMTELLLFEAARAELIDKVIRPASKEGKIILCDRFYDSTLAYQGFGRKMDTDDIKLLNRLATGGIKPDLTFYFQVSLDVSKQRSSGRNLDRMESAGDNFFLRVIDGFNKLADDEPARVIKIDASLEIKDVSDNVIRELKKIL